jgi:hypothetical protein
VALVLLVHLALGIDLPLLPIAVIVAAGAATNAACGRWTGATIPCGEVSQGAAYA